MFSSVSSCPGWVVVYFDTGCFLKDTPNEIHKRNSLIIQVRDVLKVMRTLHIVAEITTAITDKITLSFVIRLLPRLPLPPSPLPPYRPLTSHYPPPPPSHHSSYSSSYSPPPLPMYLDLLLRLTVWPFGAEARCILPVLLVFTVCITCVQKKTQRKQI